MSNQSAVSLATSHAGLFSAKPTTTTTTTTIAVDVTFYLDLLAIHTNVGLSHPLAELATLMAPLLVLNLQICCQQISQ